jgi:uncharacterized membrane protein
LIGSMGGWAEFATALSVFLLSHVVPTRPAIKARLKSALGEGGFLTAYSLISVVLLAWIIAAAGRAPYLLLWDFEPWQMWVPNLLMPNACLVVAFGVAAPNPLSFGGWAVERFDADRPGIAGVSRHPLLLGLTLWAAGHVVPNGDLAHAVLFGAFAVFSIAGMLAIDVRRQRTMGRHTWDTLAARTSLVPCAALLDGRWRPSVRQIDPLRLGIAVLVWAILLSVHSPVIGVSPLPSP